MKITLDIWTEPDGAEYELENLLVDRGLQADFCSDVARSLQEIAGWRDICVVVKLERAESP